MDMASYDGIVDLLVAKRRERGESQDALAANIGVHQTNVSSWERRRTRAPVEDLIRWANHYGLDLSIVPIAESRDGALTTLLANTTTLDAAQLDALVKIASGLGDVSPTILALMVELATTAGAQRVAQSA